MNVGKIEFFVKALVVAQACGVLLLNNSGCAMWVGNCFEKCAVAKKIKNLGLA